MSGRDAFVLGAAVVLALLITAGMGVAVGIWWATRRQKLPPKTSDGLSEALAALERAGALCDALTALTEQQVTALLERQQRLATAIQSLQTAASRISAPALPTTLHWERQPLDAITQLPDAAAFGVNLSRLIAAGRGSLLLVSVDRLESLRQRCGVRTVEELRRLVSRLLCRTGRDADLTCTLADDLFAVLLTDADAGQGLLQAAAVRDALRAHRFQPEADGPEVLVTASLGITPLQPGDEAQQVQERAAVAVAHSRRLGRNRLHIADAASGQCLPVDAP